jgi:hypothetical protein
MTITTAALNQIATNLRNYAHLPDQFHRRDETARYIGTIFGLVNNADLTDNLGMLQSCARRIVEVTVQIFAINRLASTGDSSPLENCASEVRFWRTLETRKDYLIEQRADAERELNELLVTITSAQEVR